ncbi:hypothetical protein [Solicola sp. PLA-1-18]|uniref:hypothetical protein n=1 Tax=Solicola sp. PLA-1-18 TaxID=3380532 RepID=UPI003B797BC3
MADDDLTQIARDLYAERPQEFIEVRDERSKQARSDVGRTLAAAVKKLKKPSAAAWVLNALSRSAGDRLDDLDDLRAQLRAAEAAVDGVAMRQLGRDGRTLSRQIVGRGRELADEMGVTVSAAALAEAQETLRSMTVDDGVAAAVRTGFMVTAVSSTGFEAVDVSTAVAVPSALPDVPEEAAEPDDGPSATVTDLSAARTRREERAARRAEEERRRAEAQRERELKRARAHVDELSAAAKHAEKEHAATQAQVDKAERALAAAQQAADEARVAEEESRAAAEQAREAVERAQSEVDALTDP